MNFDLFVSNKFFKKISFFIIINLFFSPIAFAQNKNYLDEIGEINYSKNPYIQQNIFNSPYSEQLDDNVSFIISPGLSITSLQNKIDFMASFFAGIDINHMFRLGLACEIMPLSHSMNLSGKKSATTQSINVNSFYYCGNTLLATPFNRSLVHLNFGVFTGFGEMRYSFQDNQNNKTSSDNEIFVTIIPKIEGELNITRNLMLSLEYGYRFIMPMTGIIKDLNGSQFGLRFTILLP